MKFRIGCFVFILLLLLVAIFNLSFISTIFAKPDLKLEKPKFAASELLIKITPQGNMDEIKGKYKIKNSKKLLENFKFKDNRLAQIQKFGLDRLYKVEVEGSEDIINLSRQIKLNPNVEYAEPNYEVSTSIMPNDPNFNNLWGLNNTGQTGGVIDADIDAPEAWDITTGSSNLTVGIIDTGVDYNHPDLKDNMWSNQAEASGSAGIDDDGNGFIDDIFGYDFANYDPDPIDDYGHGTHVAGTIGALGNNGIGVVGVNWIAKMMAIKFLNSSGSGYIDGAIQSLLYANLMGAKITNNSWGGGGYSQALADAISAADSAGDLFIAAAGNNSSNNDIYTFYPASYTNKNVIAVAATDANDNLAYFSNYGATTVHVAAPGDGIFSSVPTGTCSLCDPSGYKYLSGTSMATPHVSGAAALIWGHNLTLTLDQVKARLINTSEKIDNLNNKSISQGRINLINNFENDTASPSAITDLNISAKSFNSVTLSWTATGDDGSVGTASAYDIRFSTSPVTPDNFDALPQISGEPKPLASGQTQTFTVSKLTQSTTYYFGIKVIDNVGNISSLSNVISATTNTAQVIWSDDVEASNSAWEVTGGTDGATPSASLWHISERKSSSPTHAWYYGREDTGNFNTGARNFGEIISPLISLNGIESPNLNFKFFLKTENTSSTYQPFYDKALTQVSTDNGVTWNTLSSDISVSDWTERTLDLSNYQNQGIKIKFSFDSVDSLLNDFEGWFIDDIKIIGSIYQNQKPVANPGGPYTGNEDQPISFDGSLSTDEKGVNLTYKWNFGDGSISTTNTPTVSHVYTDPGSYQLTLIVNDGELDSDPKTATVTVKDTTAPTVAITNPLNNSTVKRGSIVNITTNVSDNVGVIKVEFYINNFLKCTDTAAPFTCNWSVPSKRNVSYTVAAFAYDAAANYSATSVKTTAK